MSELGEQDIARICNVFLMNSPPGEFMEVVTDLRGIVQNDGLINDLAPTTFRNYNTDQLLTVASPAGSHQVCISKFGEVGENQYIDPRGGVIIGFDHITQQITGSRPVSSELDGDVEPYRNSIDDAVSKYVTEFYPTACCTVYGYKEGGKFKVAICISGSRYNSSNFWNGRWRSVWTCTFSPGGQIQLDGDIKVNVHYYEAGNVQLTSHFKKSASISGGNASATGNEVAKNVKQFEKEFHAALDATYHSMGETTFKALRRVLPVFKTKIEWHKIKSYKPEEMRK